MAFGTSLVHMVNNQDIEFWLYFVPFVVLMTGIFNTLNYLNTRKLLYKDIAKANIYKSLGMASTQLGVGFVKSGATGLISGQIVAQTFSNYRLAKTAKQNYDIKMVKMSEIKRLAKRYQDFPKFSMWAVFANSLAYNLTNILISIYYSIATLGFFSLAQRILGMPTKLIGSSIGQVYFQQATIEKRQTGIAVNTFNKTIKKLLILSVVIFTPLFFILPNAFEIIFGQEWRIAGEYSQIILPFIAGQFIAAALSKTNSIFEKQKISFLWQIGLLFLSIGIIFFSNFFQIEFVEFLKIFSISLFLYYGVLLFILWRVSQGGL
jgi:O-antigen/teichoic acid export membrane protein